MSSAGTRPVGRVLGIDVGTVRVGVAVSDETWTIASPLRTLRRADPQFWQELATIVAARDVSVAVVGLPRLLGGAEAEAAGMARGFAATLTARTGLHVELCDERFTSVEAERTLISGGVRRARRRQQVDAVAAALLLQTWIDRQRTRGI